MNGLGEALRELRQKRGLSQERLAGSAQITARSLRNWEANQQQPRSVELENVLNVLQVTEAERAQVYALLPDRKRPDIAAGRNESGKVASALLGPMPGLGDLLRTMRMRRGWTQKQFAVEMGVNRATVIRWEATRTVPSDEDTLRICRALNASPQEQAVALSRRLSPTEWPPQLSLEECRRQYDLLASIRAGNFALLPLMDLHAPALKRQLRMLTGQSGEALHLLAQLEALHGWWLYFQGRKAESCAANWRALNMARGMIAPGHFCVAALNILSSHATSGGTNAENGVKLLYPWLRLLPVSFHAYLLCDMALYAGKAQFTEEAASFLTQAEQCLAGSHEEDNLRTGHFRLTKARVLISSGKAIEAFEWLPPLVKGDGRIHEPMLWAEAYLAAGDKNAAASCLQVTQGLLKVAPLPAYQKKLEQLAMQL